MIATNVRTLAGAMVPLDQALGCVTTEAVLAVDDYPRFDVAAMDGFAVASARAIGASPETPVRLTIAGESRAGGVASDVDGQGACRISTGALIPAGYDAVLPRERAAVVGDCLHLTEPVVAGRNVRRSGEDARAADRVLGPGRVIDPLIIGALACYGVRHVVAMNLPCIALLPTGDEIIAPTAASERHSIHDANGPMIAAMASALGLPLRRLSAVGDASADIATQIDAAQASGAQIIVSTGGVSVGAHDLVPHALAAIGATVHFHGVAMRPGKPVLFATLADGTPFFGLPGNPVAAAVGFRFFVTAAVRAMLGLSPEQGIAEAISGEQRPGTTRILKAQHNLDSTPSLAICADQRSHTMRPLIDATCWIVVPPAEAVDRPCRRFTLHPALAA